MASDVRISDWSSDVCSSDLVSGRPMPRGFIRALGLVKASAASVNAELGLLPRGVSRAIHAAAPQVAAGEHDAQFPIDIYQRSEEHTSELQSLMRISYAVFCLKKKKNIHEK